jgi:tetratricopeptide (TPR) repeat protein
MWSHNGYLMQLLFLIAFAFSFAFFPRGEGEESTLSQSESALLSKDYSLAVQLLEKAFEESRQDPKRALNLAIAYVKAQETEKGIRAFLHALSLPSPCERAIPCPEDEECFSAIAKNNLSGLPPSEIARETLKQYLPVVQEHPDYYLLNFTIALAQANLNQYAEFFAGFYQSYLHLPDHYIVDKTKGVMHVKLAERANQMEERRRQIVLAIDDFTRAIDKNPADGHLYLLLIGLTRGKPELKERTITFLNRLVEADVSIPRRDIVPYIHEAMRCGRKDLALKIVEQAKKQYPYSRAVEAAESYIQDSSNEVYTR